MFNIQLDCVRAGFTDNHCWVHPKVGVIPSNSPTVVMTMQKLLLSGSDIFGPLNEMRSEDLGETWTELVEHKETLGFRERADDIVEGICDFTPKWHVKSRKLLGTGHTVQYRDNQLVRQRRFPAYSVYNEQTHTWSPWDVVEIPDENKFYSSGAGCTQRVDLINGEILLPIYFRGAGETCTKATVTRCSFDGNKLKYIEHGTELALNKDRGYAEPSLIEFSGKYYLTLRANDRGSVAVSHDGLNFNEPKIWTWEDGSKVGIYNTQQHWGTHGKGLFLVYTRVAENNSHVFRHRAPLFIAQVDPENLCLIKETEQILVPERGARLGNFQVTDISSDETWVTVSEWMQPIGCEKYGSNNCVYVSRLKWE